MSDLLPDAGRTCTFYVPNWNFTTFAHASTVICLPDFKSGIFGISHVTTCNAITLHLITAYERTLINGNNHFTIIQKYV
jgi:hypothetical protein